MTVADLSSRVGLHPNTVRLHLDHLVQAGLATRERAGQGRPGRPPAAYVASARAGPEASNDGYQTLADILATRLGLTSPQPQEVSAAAGRDWGRAWARAETSTAHQQPDPRQAVDHILRLLDSLGFAPRAVDGGRTVELHRCPFLEVAKRHPEVVCGVHLGLLQGALAEMDAPVRATHLEPFVTPQLCLARLETVDATNA